MKFKEIWNLFQQPYKKGKKPNFTHYVVSICGPICTFYLLKYKHMHVKILIHTNDSEHIKETLERLVELNISNKLSNYLNKFEKDDAEASIDVSVDKNKKGLFDGKVQANLDGKPFRFEREDYKNMDDLVNHLFDHFKESLSSM